MVLGGVATFLKVGQHGISVDKRQAQAVCFFHDTDAPVDICRVAILQVIGKLACNIQTGIEGLMTDEHSLLEGTPGQFLWGTMGAQVQKASISIGNSCVAIDDGRPLALSC